MRVRVSQAVLAAALAGMFVVGCTPPPPVPDGGTGAGRGGGTGGGGGLTPFEITSLDPSAREPQYFAMAVDPVTERVGVAYFTPAGTEMMPGHPDFDLKYLEWRQGQVTLAPERIRGMQRMVGLTLAFEPTTGEPVVGYLGGAPGFVMGESIFWFQNEASYARRTGGTWTETVVASTGDEVTCGNVVSDRGFLVGLWPSIVFDSSGKMYFGYRDGHDGQFPLQDWSGSDVEVWEGVPRPTTGVCVAQGGNNKDAYGGHVRLVMGRNNQPAVVHDQMFGTSDSNGINLLFQQRNANGTWTAPGGSLVTNANTQTGASLGFDETEGYGIAYIDRTVNQLSYIKSANGTQWSSPDPVFGSGSGGWFPWLAMDPVHHEPAIAFYICSPRNSVADTACNITDDELRVTQRIAGTWRETVVDTGGGHSPKLGFFASGKRVIVYRVPPAIDPATGLTVVNVGELKIAVER